MESVWTLADMSAVAAEQFGVRRPEGAPLSDDHHLYLTLVDVDHHVGASLRVHEKDDGEDGHLKLGAGPDEGAADRLHQAVPAELEVQDVVVLVRLQVEAGESELEEMWPQKQVAWRQSEPTKSCSLALYPL